VSEARARRSRITSGEPWRDGLAARHLPVQRCARRQGSIGESTVASANFVDNRLIHRHPVARARYLAHRAFMIGWFVDRKHNLDPSHLDPATERGPRRCRGLCGAAADGESLYWPEDTLQRRKMSQTRCRGARPRFRGRFPHPVAPGLFRLGPCRMIARWHLGALGIAPASVCAGWYDSWSYRSHSHVRTRLRSGDPSFPPASPGEGFQGIYKPRSAHHQSSPI